MTEATANRPCSRCNTGVRHVSSKGAVNSWCHPCRVEARIPRKRLYTSNSLKKSYGITIDEFDAMLDGQGGVCKLCGHNDRKFVADHCHITGRFRGVLCHPCNVALGILGDNVAGLKRAYEYVQA